MSEEKSQEITLGSINASALVGVTEWQKKIDAVIQENPFVAIVDNATYEAAKKSRSALKSLRASVINQDKVIASAFTKARKETMDMKDILVAKIVPVEDPQQAEVDRWEKIIADKKAEKERIENERIGNIRNKVLEIEESSYTLINKMQFSDIDEIYKKVCALINSEFDFEEYDILLRQAESRILTAFSNKQTDLTEKEAQRAENERLEREQEQLKKVQELQNKRLSQIAAYIPFTTGLNVVELNVYSDDEFATILTDAKALKEESDHKAELDKQQAEREKQEALERQQEADKKAEAERLDREQKEQEQIKQRFEVRVKRLTDLGMQLDHLDDFSSLDCDYSIAVDAVFSVDDSTFENIYNFAKESFSKRIAENDEKEKKAEEEKKRLAKQEKENKARQKALAGDKSKLEEYINTLDFHGTVPELSHKVSEDFMDKFHAFVTHYKEQLINHVKNEL